MRKLNKFLGGNKELLFIQLKDKRIVHKDSGVVDIVSDPCDVDYYFFSYGDNESYKPTAEDKKLIKKFLDDPNPKVRINLPVEYMALIKENFEENDGDLESLKDAFDETFQKVCVLRLMVDKYINWFKDELKKRGIPLYI